jgi:hypothetical protein
MAAGLLLLPVCGTGLAQDSPRPSLEASVALGVVFGGEFTEEDDWEIDYETDAGFYGKTSLDFFPIEYFGMGLYLAGGTTSTERYGDTGMLEVGVGIKPRLPFELTDTLDFLVTPSLYLGYRGLFPEESDSIDGLGLNVGFDLRLRSEDHWEFFVEPGFLTQPTGGDDTDVTFGPIGYVLFGVGLSF